MIELFLSIGYLIVQIVILRELLETKKYFDSREKDEKKQNVGKTKNTHHETPRWVEGYIDDYMTSSEKDSYQ